MVFVLLRLRGSAIPRCLGAAIMSTMFSLFCVALRDQRFPYIGTLFDHVEEMVHPSALSIYASILGYVIVFRTNMALGRYWEGMTAVTQMESKWGDSFALINAFINSSMPFCKQEERLKLIYLRRMICRWFSLMSAIAMCSLRHAEGWWKPSIKDIIDDSIVYFTIKEHKLMTPMVKKERSLRARFLSAMSTIAGTKNEIDPSLWENQTLRDLREDFAEHQKFVVLGLDKDTVGLEEEAEILSGCNDKVLQVGEWISEALSFAAIQGWLKAPPPVLSRVYQEISNGMLGYNQASKVTIVPFPFPFVQMVSVLLVAFVVGAPVVIAQWTAWDSGRYFMSGSITFFVVLGYWGLNEICAELENPFGDDPNDLPLVGIHHEFVEALAETLRITPPEAFLRLMDCRVAEEDGTQYCEFRTKEEPPRQDPPTPASPVPVLCLPPGPELVPDQPLDLAAVEVEDPFCILSLAPSEVGDDGEMRFRNRGRVSDPDKQSRRVRIDA